MRTTLTLDEDVAARLQTLSRRSGRSFRDVVNETLRRGLANVPRRGNTERFVVEPQDFGRLRPGLSLDSIGDLLEHVEGPLHR